MDYVESLSVDDDGDLKFRLKSGKDFYWEYNDKQKSWEMIEKILTHIESTNMDNQVKFG